jgi:hypothetical protein
MLILAALRRNAACSDSRRVMVAQRRRRDMYCVTGSSDFRTPHEVYNEHLGAVLAAEAEAEAAQGKTH